MSVDELKGVTLEQLFKDCDIKIQCAREITESLRKTEEYFQYESGQQRVRDILLEGKTVNGETKWKFCVRLKVRKTIHHCNELLKAKSSQATYLE